MGHREFCVAELGHDGTIEIILNAEFPRDV